MNDSREVLRKTESVCPKCFCTVTADVVVRKGKVFLEKSCSAHGDYSLLLSNHPEYYRTLDEFYFSLMDKSFRQKDYIVHLTNRCDLDCPICLADANNRKTKDYPLEELREFLKRRKGNKIDLMGAEPTLRKDLTEIIKMIKASGNIAALHTNGLKIADYDYLKRLKEAGLHEVHLQFDGFSEDVYQEIRGERLLEKKMQTLDNLDRLDIATDLVVTVVKGVNEKEVSSILQYGVDHSFVKEIFFLGCRFLGKAKNMSIDRCLMPDEVIDIIEEQSKGKISRRNILLFQKLYFSLLSALSVRKCFYIQHFVIAREGKGYVSIDKIINLERLQIVLDRYKKTRSKHKKWSVIILLFSLSMELIRSGGSFALREFISYGIPFKKGFNLSKLPKKSLLLGFISACDSYSYDAQIALNCGKGALSIELGEQETGAIDNILREKLL